MKDDASGLHTKSTLAANRRTFLLGLLTAGALYAAPALLPVNEAFAASRGSKHGSRGSRSGSHGSRGSRSGRGSHGSRSGPLDDGPRS